VPNIILLLLFSLAVSSEAKACDDPSRLRHLGDTWKQTGEGAEAILEAARAVRLCESAIVEDRLFAYEWEHFLLRDQNRLAEQIALTRYFLAHLAMEAPEGLQAWARRRLAQALERMGQPLEAFEQFSAALRLRDGLSLPARAELLLDISSHYGQLGELDRAMAFALDAETLVGQQGGLQLARALMRQANLLAAMIPAHNARETGTAVRGLDLLEAAGEILGADDSTPALQMRSFVELTRSRLQLSLGREDEAAESAARAVSLARRIGLRMTLVQMLLRLAEVETIRGNHTQALQILREMEELGEADPRWLQNLYLRRGQIYHETGELQTASSHYRRAIEAVEQHRTQLGLSEWSAMRLGAADEPYRAYASLLLETGRHEEAFSWLDASRSRYLRDVRRMGVLQQGAEAERQLQAETTAELRFVKDSIRVAGAAATPELLARSGRLQAELAQQTEYIPVDPQIDIQALQRRLATDGRVLVSYFFRDQAHAFVMSADRFDVVALGTSREEVAAAREALQLPSGLGYERDDRVPAIDPAPLHRLYELLFAPIEHLVPAGAPVTILMDRSVEQVPFGMLLSKPAEAHQYDRWPFLIYRNAFSMEVAAGLMLEEHPVPRGRVPVVALGRTQFDGTAPPKPFDDAQLAPLPYVAQELRSIRRRVSGGVFALDGAARESDLYRLLPQARVLHLASHAFVSANAPLYSAIMFSADPHVSGPDGDGVLYLYELIGRELDAALVVLSGCSTARGQARSGEGVVGLHYGFRAAGAHASVATLWPVDDVSMADLMGHFYKYLARGMPKDEALRQAQLDYLSSADRDRSNPFFWAGPVLYGDPSPIVLRDRVVPPFAWFGMSLFLLLGALISGRRRSPSLHHG
jgi:CHAT domain-containing protein